MSVEKIIKHLEVGQTIILQLTDEIVIGELLVRKVPSHLRLKNCKDYRTNEDLGVNNIYYINEIRDIRVRQAEKEPEVSNKTSPVVVEDDNKVKRADQSICVTLPEEKWNKIREMLHLRIYINKYDAKYFDACKEMSNQRQIGVRLEDVRHGRRSTASILAVSTDTHIFIFDLLLLDGIKKELKAVFESETVCKVVHYSKMTYDYLKHACNIKPRFIFDTLMAYFYVSGSREVLTIADLLATLFNFPQMGQTSKDVIWGSRPITEEILSQAAFSVAFLIDIQQFLIHQHLLRSFYVASGEAMRFFSNSDEYPYEIKSVKGKEFVNGLKVEDTTNDSIDLREKPVEENEGTESDTSKSSSN